MAGELLQNERRVAEWSEARFRPSRSRSDRGRILGGWFASIGVLFWIGALMYGASPILGVVFWVSGVGLACSSLLTHGFGGATADTKRLEAEAKSLVGSVPEFAKGLAVVLTFRVDGFEYAQEYGVLTLVDGWLIFEGNRTEFSLAPHDCGGWLPLQEMLPCSRAEIRIGGLDPDVDVRIVVRALRSEDSVAQLLSAWSRGSVPQPACSVLPPLESPPRVLLPVRYRRVIQCLSIASVVGLVGSIWVGAWFSGDRTVHEWAMIWPFWFVVIHGGTAASKYWKGRKEHPGITRRLAFSRLAVCRRGLLAPASPVLVQASSEVVMSQVQS